MPMRSNLRQWFLVFVGLFLLPMIGRAQDHPKGEIFVGFSGRTGGDPILRGWNASAGIHINDQLAIVADFSGHYESRETSSGFGVPVVSVTGGVSGTGTVISGVSSFPSPAFKNSTGSDIHSFLVGPQFSQRLTGRARIFGRALFGASRVHVWNTSQIGAVPRVGILPPGQPVPGVFPYGSFVPPQPNQPIVIGPGSGCNSLAIAGSSAPNILPGPSLFPSFRRCDTQWGFSFGAGGGLDVTVAKHWAVRALQADYVNQPNVLGRGSNDFRLSSGLLYQW